MMKESKWVVSDPAPADKVNSLAAEVGIDRVLAELLVKRGVETFEQARAFFRPSLENLHDPFLMKDMDKAVERLHQAITGNEKILVYGDYDVDGTTAVALVYSFIKRYTDLVDFYIPDRYDEGYGVSGKGIKWAADNGFGLIITLDCGIKAIEKVDLAKSLGVDVIICDHHLPELELPKAIAVLDPKREDDTYPFDDLCGCGVGFKLVQAYSRKYEIPFETLIPLLDLLVVSIASDLVTVVGENRILAYYGLRQLNENPRKGLLAMINLSKLEPGHITVDDIVFKIGPRINAAGRMETGRLAVELLTATETGKAMIVGEKINNNNNERKNVDREITAEALEMVESGKCLARENVTIVYNPKWNKGVVGIVASRLVEAYFKPTVVLTSSNGFVTGSARSAGKFDLYAAIESCADLMENFGGHTYAAGLSMKVENVPEFKRRFEEYVDQNILPEQTSSLLEINAKINFKEITHKFHNDLKRFNPFGPDNPKPLFCTERVYDFGTSRVVGRHQEHIKLELVDSKSNNVMNGIAFGQSSQARFIKSKNSFDIVYYIEENSHKRGEVQLQIEDIKPSEKE